MSKQRICIVGEGLSGLMRAIAINQLPGVEGKFEILNDHAPIISTLTKGNIRVIHTNNKTELFKINSGVVEMQNNKIIVLAD